MINIFPPAKFDFKEIPALYTEFEDQEKTSREIYNNAIINFGQRKIFKMDTFDTSSSDS